MFRIRRVFDNVLPVNKDAVREVQHIWADVFPYASREEIASLPERIHHPFKDKFVTLLYVAENAKGQVIGFALMLHFPEVKFCFLDYIAAARRIKSRGVGAALYERLRDEAKAMGARGLFFEAASDEPDMVKDPVVRSQNASRLRFYERYGARPILGTAYQSPIGTGENESLPFLMFDNLNGRDSLRADYLRKVARAILEGKYPSLCPPEYVQKVVDSIQENAIGLREFRYFTPQATHKRAAVSLVEKIALVVNDKHDIHHIRERGYVEAPVRIKAISEELLASGLVEPLPVTEHSLDPILAVHDRDFVDYLERACASVPEGKSVYPYVFPIRNAARPPQDLSVRAGYYCIDTFTPINRNAFPAAKHGVDCALTAAGEVLEGRRLAYALVRPPGHHAERRLFGGFCYFNNAAVAAHFLSAHGSVAILDIDYHHGNGQQEIFYERSDVLTISIHGDPDFAYPYFTGFADEIGSGEGEGYNINLPLPEHQTGAQYRETLKRALQTIHDYEPDYLVVALGLDPAKGDPTGTWVLTAKDFELNGRMIGELGLPTLVVQEGGYRTRTLGVNARHFFQGLAHASL